MITTDIGFVNFILSLVGGCIFFYLLEYVAARMALWTRLADEEWQSQRRSTTRHWMVVAALAAEAIILIELGFTSWGIAGLGLLAICYYLAAVDIRDFWLPDHGTILLIVVGLLWSPFEALPILRIHGFVAGIVLVGGIGLVVNLVQYRRLAFDNFSGGDLVMASGIGAWFGTGGLFPILILSFIFGTVSNIVRRSGPPRFYLGEDLTERAVPEPLGVSMAAAVIVWLISFRFLAPMLTLHGLYLSL